MCGICGFSGAENRVVLKDMADCIFHRGPDEDGFYSDGEINLGMRRLSIIDVAGGHQPVHNENNDLWIVFNGEIYNSRELRKELEEKGHRFYTDHSDTEVIVHLYEEYGDNFAHKINGMFAIAVWDKKTSRLLLIRDRMGVKPLFYAVVGQTIIFASEIKAILRHPLYNRRIDYGAIYHYFSLKNIPSPQTAFHGISSLCAGSALVFLKGETSVSRWWKIRFKENQGYDGDFVRERILDLLRDATRLRMISDVPFGAYLSGGLDSSSVVAFMSSFSNKPVKTFSLGYEGELKNKEADLLYARMVSRYFHTEHYEYIMSWQELIEEIENVISAFDQPFSGTISTYFLTKLIRKHVKVALSGDAADELFGSYLSHRIALPMYYLKKMNSERLTEEEMGRFKYPDMDFLEKLYKKSQGRDVDWRYALYLFSDNEKEQLLSEEFKGNLDNASTYSLVRGYFNNLTSEDPLNRILEMEWNTQLPDQVLAFVDFLSMAHSVEIRSPFLDYRLVEFSATIPGFMKIKDGNVKDILKKTVESILPEEITKRPKEGFVLPVFDWMADRLRDYTVSVLSENRLRKHGLFNLKFVNDLLEDYYSGNRANAGRVWNLMMFQLWWERYFA